MSAPQFSQPIPFTGTPISGVNETQRISISGSPTGGTLTLTYAGQTTVAIAFDAAAAVVQAALEGLSNIAVGDVACSGGPLPGLAVDVTFQNDLGGLNVATMTATSSLTGGSGPAVAITTPTPGVRGTYRGARLGQALAEIIGGILYEQTSASPATPTWSEIEV